MHDYAQARGRVMGCREAHFITGVFLPDIYRKRDPLPVGGTGLREGMSRRFLKINLLIFEQHLGHR